MSNILLINSFLPWVRGTLPLCETAALAGLLWTIPASFLHKSDDASIKLFFFASLLAPSISPLAVPDGESSNQAHKKEIRMRR